MIFPNQLIKYGLLFLFLPIILRLFGFIDVSLFSMFSFASFFIGLTIFYYSFGTKNFLAVFFGSGIFFVGVFSFLVESFFLDITILLIVACTLYITGFSLLMVFIENAKRKTVLYAAGFLIFTATMVSLFAGNLQLGSFLSSLPEVFKEYWLLLLMAVITVLLLYFEQRQSKK